MSDPSAEQTETSIGSYLRDCPVGGEVAVRETDGGNLSFTLAVVGSIDLRAGRLHTTLAGRPGGDWYIGNGRSCVYPTGQSHLVEPTPAVRAFIREHPLGVSGWYGSIRP